jgi:hypothetical protein
MSLPPSPFTERGRITDPRRFIGRWRELSIIFEKLEARRPVLIAGPVGVGKSSLLTHIAQSAATNLERFDLESLFVDLAALPDAASCYRLVVEALGDRGDTPAALEVALIQHEGPVLLCLDNVEGAIAAGWGDALLGSLARTARRSSAAAGAGYAAVAAPGGSDLLLVAAASGPAPALSERFAVVTLGAFAESEVGLLVDAYLDESDVRFSPAELRELAQLSGGQPLALQLAADALFRSKAGEALDWREAAREAVRALPAAGAALAPTRFEGEKGETSLDDDLDTPAARPQGPPQEVRRIEVVNILATTIPVILALVVFRLSEGNWIVSALVLLVTTALATWLQRRYRNSR